MSVIDVFWRFIYERYPQLAKRDWMVDSQIIKLEDIVDPEIREFVPKGMLEFNRFVFYIEDVGKTTAVFILQDKKGRENIAIWLSINGESGSVIKL